MFIIYLANSRTIVASRYRGKCKLREIRKIINIIPRQASVEYSTISTIIIIIIVMSLRLPEIHKNVRDITQSFFDVNTSYAAL